MKIIISPAKKMKDVKTDRKLTIPVFIDDAITLSNFLKTLNEDEIAKSYKIKGKLLSDTISLIANFNVYANLKPAIFTYDGIQYKYMDPLSLDNSSLDYLEDSLCIISGLYGVVRPFDTITNYRLMMENEFKGKDIPNMYKYWNSKIHDYIYKNEKIILNLCSLEFSKSIKPYLKEDEKLVDVFFYEIENNKFVEKGVYAKMLRGLMVRYLAENKINSLNGVKNFNQLGYSYSDENSTDTKIVFIKH